MIVGCVAGFATFTLVALIWGNLFFDWPIVFPGLIVIILNAKTVGDINL